MTDPQKQMTVESSIESLQVIQQYGKLNVHWRDALNEVEQFIHSQQEEIERLDLRVKELESEKCYRCGEIITHERPCYKCYLKQLKDEAARVVPSKCPTCYDTGKYGEDGRENCPDCGKDTDL